MGHGTALLLNEQIVGIPGEGGESSCCGPSWCTSGEEQSTITCFLTNPEGPTSGCCGAWAQYHTRCQLCIATSRRVVIHPRETAPGAAVPSAGGEVLDVEPIGWCVWCPVRFFRFWVDFILILRCVLKNVLSGFELGVTIKKGVKPYSTVTVAGMRAKGLIVYVLRGGICFPQSSRGVCFKSRSWGSE